MSNLQNIKGAAPREENAPSKTLPPQNTKQTTILTILKSGQSLNRFEAECLGDHTLNSTVSVLRSKGHIIVGSWEWVNTRFGSEVHVMRYSYVGAQGSHE